MLPAVQAQSLNPCTAREVPSVCCLIGIFVFLILSCMSCLCILGINLLLVILFAAIFSHTMDCLFVSSVASFPVQMLLNLIMSYFIFAFVSFAIVDIYQKKKKKATVYVRMFCLFSPKSFKVSCLTCMSLIHFEFTFVCDVRKDPNFICLSATVQFSQNCLLKRLSFPHCVFLLLLS